MKFTVTEVGEDFVRVWDGKSKVDKRPDLKHTDQYFVGKDHGFEVNDVVQIMIRKQPGQNGQTT